jgi:hypothetical protein
MQFFFFNLVLLTLSSVLVKASTTQVGIKKRSTPCLNKAKKGDKISVHYTVYIAYKSLLAFFFFI